MFYDLNIPVEVVSPAFLKRLEDLGWNAVAINYTITGKPPKEACTFQKSKQSSLHQYSRLTVILDDPQQNVSLTSSSILQSFDILAVRPTTERTFQIACQSLDVDIISLDLSDRLPFTLKHGLVREAIARGVMFEVSYGPSITAPAAGGKRRASLSSTMHLARVIGKAKGLIVSSGHAVGEYGLRAPHCVRNWSEMIGIKPDGSKTCIVDNPVRVIRHAGDRKFSVRGAIVRVKREEEVATERDDFYSDYIKMLQ